MSVQEVMKDIIFRGIGCSAVRQKESMKNQSCPTVYNQL